ncbi:MAG: hypothetical protein ACRDN0_18995 [Trebonia sp.]
MVTPESSPGSPALVIVVDVANVMGSRADGWWRDRAAAALRLCREVDALAARGIPPERRPAGSRPAEGRPAKARSAEENPAEERPVEGRTAPPERSPSAPDFPRYVLVLEGRARAAAGLIDAPGPRTRIVQAPGSGDDTIVTESAAAVADAGSCLVVTADRELRERCRDVGASVAGPGWLIDLL